MKNCRKCDVSLELGINTYPSTYNRGNFICKSCHNKQTAPHSKKWRNTGSGIYGIFSSNVPLYVGESERLNDRICQHKQGIKSPTSHGTLVDLYYKLQKYTDIEIKVLEYTDNAHKREKYWIQKLQPKYNERRTKK